MSIIVPIMELQSGSISGAKDKNIVKNVDEMVENKWEVIEKQVAMFFVEEQKQRKELINKFALMRENNLKLRDNLNDLKLLISSQATLLSTTAIIPVFLLKKR